MGGNEMTIDADAPAVVAGLGLFETMLTVNGIVIQRDEHFRRLAASCEALGLPVIDVQTFRDVTARAVSSELESALRITWVIETADRWRMFAKSFPIPAATLARRALGRARTLSPAVRRSLPQHKLTSYAVCSLALRDAVAAGMDEALFMCEAGVLEGTASNVFAVQNESLVTAPVAAGVLPGVVRAWVVEHAHSFGLSVVERVPTISEIEAGGFFTGSLTTIASVRAIDGRPCRPHAVVEQVAEAYRRMAGLPAL
jgi:branched-chain amino acid aminotransferase